MRVEEKTIPWWRKALKIALGGIRSGFGLFSRSRKPEAAADPEIPEKSAESRNEEPVLTESLPQPEIAVSAPSIPAPSVAEIAVAPEPVAEPIPEMPVAVEPEPVEPTPEPETTEAVTEIDAEPISELVIEPAFTHELPPVVADELQSEGVAASLAQSAPTEQETQDELVSELSSEEPELVTEPESPAVPDEAIPELVEAAETVAEVVSFVEPVASTEQTIEPALEPESVINAVFEPQVESEPEVTAALEIQTAPEIVNESVPESPTIAESEPEPYIEPVNIHPIAESVVAPPELAEITEIVAEIETSAVPEPASDSDIELPSEPVQELPPPVEAEPVTEAIPTVEPIEIEQAVEPVTALEPPKIEPIEAQFESEPEIEPETAEELVSVPAELLPEPAASPEPVIEADAIPPVAESQIEPDNSFTGSAAAQFVEAQPESEPIAETRPNEARPNQESIVIVATDPQPEFHAASEPEAETALEPAIETQPEPIEAAIEAEALPAGPAGATANPPLVLTPEPTVEELANAKAEERVAAKLAARQKRLDEGSEQSPFSIVVGQVYDGPLDLLLDLIRKQDIDIYDIPIAKITAQFLAYVNQLKSGDVDVAGEFIYTASLLIHIKSKMLLPRATTGPDDAAEDPRRELVERLLEHERFKSAAQMLQQKQMLEAATWTNPGVREFKDDAAAEPEIAADTVDLVRIFRDILERARKRPVFSVDEESVTVGQMIQFLGRRLTMEDKPIALRRLLSHTRSERALIAMFLALLELVRMQAILLRQDKLFSEIFIKKHTGFDAVMNEGLINAQDDWR
jgi:segregation and condensation protein A